MRVFVIYIHIDLEFVDSLKGRRKIINSIKDRLKTKNLSILDISAEYAKEIDLVLSFLSIDERSGKIKLQNIQNFLDDLYPELNLQIDYEII